MEISRSRLLQVWVSEWIFQKIESEKERSFELSCLKIPTANPEWDFPPWARVELPNEQVRKQGTMGSSLPFNAPPLLGNLPLLSCFSISPSSLLSKNRDQCHLTLYFTPPPLASSIISSHPHTRANASYTTSLQPEGTEACGPIRS